MTKLAIIILIFITSLPLSQKTENSLQNKVINSPIGKELKIEKSNEHKKTVVDKKEIVLPPLPYKNPTYTNFVPWSKSTKTIDLSTDKVLFEKNPNERLPIASLTKLMTAIVAYENTNPNEIVTIPPLKNMPGEAIIGLRAGEKIKVNELIHGMLINSAGDATYTLALHISKTENDFIKLMNKRAEEMMLYDTHFSNASGYVDKDNYSTANDLINLTRLFLNNNYFKNIVSKKTYQAKNEAGRVYNLKTTNRLLDNKRVFGIKTGYTPQAGECLITLANQNDHKILTIVLGSTARFAETNNLLNWIYTNWSW